LDNKLENKRFCTE